MIRKMFQTGLASVGLATMALVTLPTSIAAAPMNDEILALRTASNRAIAAHDAAGSVASLSPDFVTITSGGTLLQGRDAMKQAFADRMADPIFVKFERTPIEIAASDMVAMERGTWVGVWQDRQVGGCYLARWERTGDGWRLKAEHYVPTPRPDAC